MQAAADSKNSKELSKDGTKLHTSIVEITKRCKEHFSYLLNWYSHVDQSALNHLQERPIVEYMNNPVALEEVKISISKLNMEMAVRKDCIFAEILWYDGDHLANIMHRIILNIRNAGGIPKDWRYVILIPLYEGKHMNELCVCIIMVYLYFH